jgi:hypothetical protein
LSGETEDLSIIAGDGGIPRITPVAAGTLAVTTPRRNTALVKTEYLWP